VRKTSLIPPLALALGLTLTACASEEPTSSTGAAASTAPSASASAGFNQADVRFTQSMLPHHMQAARDAEIEI
jgi:uncharacterized protein (DUF305 family)